MACLPVGRQNTKFREHSENMEFKIRNPKSKAKMRVLGFGFV